MMHVNNRETHMPNTSAEVDQYMSGLDHPLKDSIQQLRVAVLDSNPGISESVKWNAPNFRYAGQDRVTFRLQPRNKLQLIFHRGVQKRSDTADFTFTDTTGLMTWVAPDRAVVDFPDEAAVVANQDAVVALVNLWVAV
jgi:hypothetical protein